MKGIKILKLSTEDYIQLPRL